VKRAAISANALRLPAMPSATLEIVRGRQRVVRRGIFFTLFFKRRRSVYAQLDGEIILADECQCIVHWPENGGPFGLSFEILRSASCPIDEHRRLTLQEMQGEDPTNFSSTGNRPAD
jgi:hypothetical protein